MKSIAPQLTKIEQLQAVLHATTEILHHWLLDCTYACLIRNCENDGRDAREYKKFGASAFG